SRFAQGEEMRVQALSTVAAVAAVVALMGSVSAQEVGPLAIAKQGYFFVGGKYFDTPNGKVMAGHAYVEYLIPQNRTHRFPLVMIAGGAMSGANFTGTPDGRDGWAQFFVARGYAVYLVDQVGRGRSPYVESVYGKSNLNTSKFLMERFVTVARYKLWPQARLHTQWPGTAEPGDPIYDQMQAQELSDIANAPLREQLNRDAGVALFDKIGPAVLFTHSQSGAYGWAIADARPGVVKAIVAIEAGMRPFRNVEFVGAPDYFRDGPVDKVWGIGNVPLAFVPQVSDPSELAFLKQEKPDAPDLVSCILQREPARQLVNLKSIPIMILTSEAGFHATSDHCNSLFLKQAGVDNDFIRLPDIGIHGNSHYLMLEKNSMQIAGVVADWLGRRVTPAEAKEATTGR
ncbi:MAG TPA: alpha/beta hydrolase, partial [Xanthobacteraceae bacterium]|nr:alpha/beta hydrolase [Xanthobacteraceae bacterium]